MNVRIKLALLALSFSLLAQSPANAQQADVIAAAVNDATRMQEHRERDASRKPADVLALAGIKPGAKIGEIAAGGGYYTALLSRVVGKEGTVYSVDPSLIFEAFPQAREGFQKYIESDPRDNVIYTVQRLDEFKVPEKLDAIFMVLYYHDTYWTGENRASMNRRFLDALKPGGILFVLDHSAKKGSEQEVTRSLHRMDEALLIPEVTSAGFELVASSDLLRNPNDPLDTNVFDPEWRGNTDRFIHIFKKPID